MSFSGKGIKFFSLLSVVGILAVIPAIVESSKEQSGTTMNSSESQESIDMKQVSGPVTQFGINLMKEVPSGSNANLIFSPLSIQTLLNMILLGATDDSVSQTELIRVLGYNKADLTDDRLKLHQRLAKLISSFKAPEKENKEEEKHDQSIIHHHDYQEEKGDHVNISLANMVLANRDLTELKQGYAEELATYYQAKIEEFRESDLKGLSEKVNKWVKEKTNNKIQNVVEDSDLNNKDLLMVLLNAAHFKGSWADKFYEANTKDRQFFNLGSENNIKQVKFMSDKDDYDYVDLTAKDNSEPLAKQLDCQILSKSFANPNRMGERFSMVFLLPSEINGLPKLEASLNSTTLSQAFNLLKRTKVDVKIPKFSLESSLNMKDSLSKMGMKTIFNEAHLNRMHKNLEASKVDKIIHKAMIKVDEAGAEAAAVTASTIMLMSLLIETKQPQTFEANHPFLFIIRHDDSGLPIFMGRVGKFE